LIAAGRVRDVNEAVGTLYVVRFFFDPIVDSTTTDVPGFTEIR